MLQGRSQKKLLAKWKTAIVLFAGCLSLTSVGKTYLNLKLNRNILPEQEKSALDHSSTKNSKAFVIARESRNASPIKEYGLVQVEASDKLMDPTRGWDNAPIVIPEHKLLFFTIPKVGCSTWKQLFRRVQGFENWQDTNGNLIHNPKANGLSYLFHYNLSEATRMMTHPTWTRAMFVRDPKHRLLSAYMDKGLGERNKNFMRMNCCPGKSIAESCWPPGDNRTFELFVNLTAKCRNWHWKPQSERLEGKFWGSINYVGRLENLAVDGERLLRKVGIWERYGSSGWGPHQNLSLFNLASRRNHAADSSSKFSTMYTAELERKVEQRYKTDYDHPVLGFARTRLASEI